jgi:hypothetical protein
MMFVTRHSLFCVAGAALNLSACPTQGLCVRLIKGVVVLVLVLVLLLLLLLLLLQVFTNYSLSGIADASSILTNNLVCWPDQGPAVAAAAAAAAGGVHRPLPVRLC